MSVIANPANEGQIKANFFETGRGLRTRGALDRRGYLNLRGFGQAMKARLLNLEENDWWLELGVGQLNAPVDYLTLPEFSCRPHAKIAVVSFADPDTEPFERNLRFLERELGDRFIYCSGRYAEDIPLNELPPARLASDCFGPITFTEHVDVTLGNLLSRLAPGGSLIAQLRKLFITDGAGRPFGRKRYLESVEGADLLFYGFGGFEMQRTSEGPVSVPALRLDRFVPYSEAPNPGNADPRSLFCERYCTLEGGAVRPQELVG